MQVVGLVKVYNSKLGLQSINNDDRTLSKKIVGCCFKCTYNLHRFERNRIREDVMDNYPLPRDLEILPIYSHSIQSPPSETSLALVSSTIHSVTSKCPRISRPSFVNDSSPCWSFHHSYHGFFICRILPFHYMLKIIFTCFRLWTPP